MKALLVDDHALFVEGLRVLLEANQIEVVGTAGDGLEALEQVKAHQPDVVLMDIHMPHCSGLEGVKLIKAQFPQVKVVMLTMSVDDADLFGAIKSGAAGYIVKDVKPRVFLELLAGVMRGEAALSREMATRIMGEYVRSESQAGETPATLSAHKGRAADTSGGLSLRQTEILRFVADGYTYKEVAAALSISERTVNYHMAEILNKLQLQNRAQVIAYATRHGLLGAGT